MPSYAKQSFLEAHITALSATSHSENSRGIDVKTQRIDVEKIKTEGFTDSSKTVQKDTK